MEPSVTPGSRWLLSSPVNNSTPQWHELSLIVWRGNADATRERGAGRAPSAEARQMGRIRAKLTSEAVGTRGITCITPFSIRQRLGMPSYVHVYLGTH